ncbi:MAG: translation elongation factor Ts [Bacilli bacterium]
MMINAGMVKELRDKTGAGMLDCKKALEANNGKISEAIDWLREKGIAKAAKKSERIAAEGLAAILIENDQAVILEMNSETDFVAKNSEFQNLITIILNAIISNNVNNEADVLALKVNGTSLNDLIVQKTAKIGEKLSFRRFEKITKKDNEVFGSYIHMGGKIAVLTVLEGTESAVAKDVAMHIAAMHPIYIRTSDVQTEEIEKEKLILKEQAINEGKSEEISLKMVAGGISKYYKEICLEEQPFVKDGNINVATYVKNNNSKIVNMIRYMVGEGMEKRQENFADEVAKQMEK